MQTFGLSQLNHFSLCHPSITWKINYIFFRSSYVHQRAEPVIFGQEQVMIFLKPDQQQGAKRQPGRHFVHHFLEFSFFKIKPSINKCWLITVKDFLSSFELLTIKKTNTHHSNIKISSIAVKLGPLALSLCANQSYEYIVKCSRVGHGSSGHFYFIYSIHRSENEHRGSVICH